METAALPSRPPSSKRQPKIGRNHHLIGKTNCAATPFRRVHGLGRVRPICYLRTFAVAWPVAEPSAVPPRRSIFLAGGILVSELRECREIIVQPAGGAGGNVELV